MGGDNDPETVFELGAALREQGHKTGWYSGRGFSCAPLKSMDYYKTGPWIADYGPLNSPTTNQRLYQIVDGHPVNITDCFWTRENLWQPQQEETIQQNLAEWQQGRITHENLAS